MDGYRKLLIEYKVQGKIIEGRELEINPCDFCIWGYGGTGDTKPCYLTCVDHKEYNQHINADLA